QKHCVQLPCQLQPMASSSSQGISGRKPPPRGPSHLAVDVKAIRGSTAPLAVETKVYFHMSYSDVLFGETVRVVGNHPSLGSWDTTKGIVLQTNEDIFPVWVSRDPAFVALHSKVEYKYVVCHSDGQHKAREENRTFVASGTEMTIEDDNGLYREKMGTVEEEQNDRKEGEDFALKVRSPMVRQMDKEQKLAFVRGLEEDIEINTTDTIFMLAYQLPVNVFKDSDGVWKIDEKAPNDGRNFAWAPLLQDLRKKTSLKVVCVGWPGVHVDSGREKAQIEKALAAHDCIPVFPPRKEFDKFIEFSLEFLWPVFHDVMSGFQSVKPMPFNDQGWAAFQHINNIYANVVVTHTHGNDLIWIHDYHMIMTPTFISRKLHKANIGFFLHTPFPSSDSFKSLPIREELLSGMLCADQLGFQFFAYARNFLVSCKRIYGLDPTYRAGGFMGLEYNGRTVMVKVGHFVYPYKDSELVVRTDIVAKKAAEVKSIFEGKRLFVSMDRCDGLSGLLPKFRAFKQFLHEHPEYKGKVALVQYCFGSLGGYSSKTKLVEALREQADAFLQLDQNGVLTVVDKEGRGKDESCDIYLRIEKIDRVDRLALFRASNVLLDTSVKNGLNLMPFEFITAHYDDVAQHSVAIVSEFSGCSRVLKGSIKVNPWNTTEIVTACERALAMDDDERKERAETDFLYMSENSPMEWFEDFLTDLRRSRKKDDLRIESIGFGARVRQVCVGQNFQKLPINAVLQSYRNSKNRVFFFDNEGTLAADKRHLVREYGAPKGDVSDLKSHGSAPDEHVLKCLRILCSDSRNTVVILSGRNREMLEEWFGSVQKIGLAAERGFYYRLPITTGDKWHCMVQQPDYTWKTHAFEIMRQFVKRTQGSFIENKGSALVWQYRDADPHFGAWQAKELSGHLKELLVEQSFDVEVVEGKGYVEVKLRGINKGVTVTKSLAKVAQAVGEVDFVLCIGDDRSDEDMFEAVNLVLDPSEEVNAEDSSQRSTTDGEGESDSHSDRDRTQPDSRLSKGVSADGLLSLSGVAGSGLGARKGGGFPSKSSSGKLGSFGGDLSSFGGGGGGDLSSLSEDKATASSSSQRRFWTCTVGRKPSAAKFYLDDTDEVSELLASLRQKTEGRAKEMPPNYNTWSGGDLSGRSGRSPGSMPGLSSLSFGSDR
ncbi:unnamed protein product, partial [Polarella glacialis]